MSVWTRILLRYLLGYLVLYNVIPNDIAAMIQDDPEISLIVGGALAGLVEGLTILARRFRVEDMNWLIKLLTGGIIKEFTGPLLAAYQAKLDASNDAERIAAEQNIKSIEAARDIAIAEAADRWSATRLGRWLIVVPFGLWWAAIYIVQIVNPWFGTNLVVIDVPPRIHEMALILIPAIVIGDVFALVGRRNR